jgi:hypothetical protein
MRDTRLPIGVAISISIARLARRAPKEDVVLNPEAGPSSLYDAEFIFFGFHAARLMHAIASMEIRDPELISFFERDPAASARPVR